MPQQNTPAPTGPRGRGGNRHPSNRGGVQKPRGGPRVDRDGDVDMDRASERGRGRGMRDRGNGGTLHPTFNTSNTDDNGVARAITAGPALQKAIARGLANGNARLESRRGVFSERGVNSNPRGGRAQLQRSTSLDQIKVHGLRQSKAATNPDGGLSNLLSFLERKASGSDSAGRDPVKIIKSREQGDAVFIHVRPQDAPKILRLDNFTFAGAQLAITQHSRSRSPRETGRPDPAESTQHVKQVLSEILSRRYDPANKYLDLSALGKDSELVGLGTFNRTSTSSKFFPALMRICDDHFANKEQKREAIVSISLADNELKNVSLVTSVALTFPDIKNLDLSRNKFENLGAISAWRWRFKNLDHLILSGNPLEQVDPSYSNTLRRWYASLRLLNHQQIRSDAEAAASIAASAKAAKGKLPIPIQPGNFKDDDHIGENFLKQFFLGYDADRTALVNTFYDAQSSFSFSVNTSAPRGQQADKTNLKSHSWDEYIRGSRNLMKITHLPSRMSRMHTGTDNIRQCFTSLPATRHPDLINENHKWLLECRPLTCVPDPTNQYPRGVDGLMVTVHSEFDEMSHGQNIVKRSFDRTFVLGPGGPAGVRVVSDVLTLRAYGGFEAFIPNGTDPAQLIQEKLQQQLPAGFGVVDAGKTQEQAQKELMVVEVARQTGLTPQYAGMCLEETGWNFDGAVAAFQNARGNLPAEAFL
ncbi:MAG: nuclear mRNA export, poly(A)+RNA binding protein [Sclerophora amabilis]|nr:MAG: nuclear mRNA export, poly(A)+RNA binding protein [Sclerophora amabilis]